MKKFLVGIFVLAATLQARADKEYLCIDAKTGADAGKFFTAGENPDADRSGKIIYANLRTSTDGWILKITEDGNLYNADSMVRGGKEFYVGKLTLENFHIAVTINNRKMLCK